MVKLNFVYYMHQAKAGVMIMKLCHRKSDHFVKTTSFKHKLLTCRWDEKFCQGKTKLNKQTKSQLFGNSRTAEVPNPAGTELGTNSPSPGGRGGWVGTDSQGDRGGFNTQKATAQMFPNHIQL